MKGIGSKKIYEVNSPMLNSSGATYDADNTRGLTADSTSNDAVNDIYYDANARDFGKSCFFK